MSRTSKEQPLVTLPLNDTIAAIIGDELGSIEYAPISPTIAMIFRELFAVNNYSKAIVQTHDFDNELLDCPLLWHSLAYRRAKELHTNQREYKHKQWVKDQIASHNLNLVLDSINRRTGGMKGEDAGRIASKILRANSSELLKAFGVDKLITKEEELP